MILTTAIIVLFQASSLTSTGGTKSTDEKTGNPIHDFEMQRPSLSGIEVNANRITLDSSVAAVIAGASSSIATPSSQNTIKIKQDDRYMIKLATRSVSSIEFKEVLLTYYNKVAPGISSIYLIITIYTESYYHHHCKIKSIVLTQ